MGNNFNNYGQHMEKCGKPSWANIYGTYEKYMHCAVETHGQMWTHISHYNRVPF
jgi:hypothetical protein